MSTTAVALQRAYYERTATHYDTQHVTVQGEHDIALAALKGFLPFLDANSILDVGSGTGRGVSALLDQGYKAVGVEPSEALRSQGYAKGLSPSQLVDGDAQALNYPDGSFDVVCAFAALHHIPQPRVAVAEMVRVARKAVFISDVNCYGSGSPFGRFLKRALRGAGLWRTFDQLRTRGRGYQESESDGIFYSYSVLDDIAQIQAACSHVVMMNTTPASPNIGRDASHMAVLGIKR